jgi:hypothetical protein
MKHRMFNEKYIFVALVGLVGLVGRVYVGRAQVNHFYHKVDHYRVHGACVHRPPEPANPPKRLPPFASAPVKPAGRCPV